MSSGENRHSGVELGSEPATPIELRVEDRFLGPTGSYAGCVLLQCEKGSNGTHGLRIEGFKGLNAFRESSHPVNGLSEASAGTTEIPVLLLDDRTTSAESVASYLESKGVPRDVIGVFNRSPKSNAPILDGTYGSYRVISHSWFRACSRGPSLHTIWYGVEYKYLPLEGEYPSPYKGSGETWRLNRLALLESVSLILMPEMLLIRVNGPHADLNKDVHDHLHTYRRDILPRLVSRLDAHGDARVMDLANVTLQTLHHMIIEEEYRVLNCLDEKLQDVDRQLAFPRHVRDNVEYWQVLMRHWRPYLHSKHEFLIQYSRMLKKAPVKSGQETSSHVDGIVGCNERTRQDLADLLEDMKFKNTAVTQHCESTFNALMITMSLVESERAITEAEEVTKLTQLAFFFIPLTFVAGIFGMNLGVSKKQSL